MPNESIFPFKVFDSFSTTRPSGQGFGKTDGGVEWKVSTSTSLSAFSTAPLQGLGKLTGVKGRHTIPDVTYLNVAPAKSQGLLFAFRPTSYTDYTDFGPVLLRRDASSYVTLRIQAGFGYINFFRRTSADSTIQRLYAGAVSTNPVNGDPAFSAFRFDKTQWYWCRVEYEYSTTDDKLHARIWREGDPEPTDWNLTVGAKANGISWDSGTPGFMSFDTTSFGVDIRCAYYYSELHPSTLTTVDSFDPYPLVDTFDRTATDGLGVLPDSHTVWRGNVLDTPLSTRATKFGGVGLSALGTRAAILTLGQPYQTNGGYWGFLGNTASAEMEVTATVSSPNSGGNVKFRIGARGREYVTNGATDGTGYAAEVQFFGSSSFLRLVSREQENTAGWAVLEEFQFHDNIGIVPNTQYRLRFQMRRAEDYSPSNRTYDLNAKIWAYLNADGSIATEPSQWTITTTVVDTVLAGSSFLNCSMGDSGRNGVINVHSFSASETVTTSAAPQALFFRDQVDIQTDPTDDTKVTLAFYYDGDAAGLATGNIVLYPTGDTSKKTTITFTADDTTFDGVTRRIEHQFTGLVAKTAYSAVASLDSAGTPVRQYAHFTTLFSGVSVRTPLIYGITPSGFSVVLPVDPYTKTSGIDQDLSATVAVKRLGTTLSTTPMRYLTDAGEPYPGPRLAAAVSGLAFDTSYEVVITVTDPYGVNDGTSTSIPITEMVTTEGTAPELAYADPLLNREVDPIVITPSATSARVEIHYRWDVANEVAFSLRYRPLQRGATTWRKWGNSASFAKRVSDISDKKWATTLIGLVPGWSYEMEITGYHPSGFKGLEAPYVIKRTFQTEVGADVLKPRPKHYLFKVYSGITNAYQETWDDATQPSFAFHENGGVSDMSITLPRSLSTIYTDPAFTFGNRVDCWVIDHTSDGIGENLIIDSDMSLGGWTHSRHWSIDPRGGPDTSSALKVDTAGSATQTANYAVSEFIDLPNATFKSAQYQVLVTISTLFNDFEQSVVKNQIRYEESATAIRQKVYSLAPSAGKESFTSQIDRQLAAMLDGADSLLQKVGTSKNFASLGSIEVTVSVDNYLSALEIQRNAESIGCVAVISDRIEYDSVPFVLQLAAKAEKGQITAQVEYYDIHSPFANFTDVASAVSEESASTNDNQWQILKFVFTPPLGTRRMRVRLTAQGDTVGYVDKALLLPQELLIYRGTIESVSGEINAEGESVKVEVLGLVSKLTDYYIPFAQWVDRQPKRDQPRYVDPYMFDSDDPPALFFSVATNLTKPRESLTGDNRQSAIVFPEITSDHLITRVYYDGDDNVSATCNLFYTRNLNAVFPPVETDVVTAFTTGQTVWFGGSEPEALYSDKRETKISGSLLVSGQQLIIKSTGSVSNGWNWYQVQTTDNRTGYVKGELLRKTSNDSSSYLWNKVSTLGRSTGKGTTGTLIKPYNFALTKDDPNSTTDNEYSASAQRDKRYFEYKITTDALDSRTNFQIVARISDADGVLDEQNQPLAYATSINTAPRLLFPELNVHPFVGIANIRNDNDPRTFEPPADPATMIRSLLDRARVDDPTFTVFYSDSSIRSTSLLAQYTFRDTQLRNAIDKARELCPPGWHWFVDAEGVFTLRGPQHTKTHRLHIGQEIVKYSVERTIKNVKNYVIVRGRQDSDMSEPDGSGSVSAFAQDDTSIRSIGARYLYIRDSNLKDAATAQTVAYGRLEENKKPETQGSVYILDEKEVGSVGAAMRGYNIESIKPGDFIIIDDGEIQQDRVYWDQTFFNQSYWDAGDQEHFDELIQIKSINYYGDHVELSLSQRPPSSVGDFAKLVRWQQMQESMTND